MRGDIARPRQPDTIEFRVRQDPAQPLLAQRARAELVAALSMVDYVVLSNREAAAGTPLDTGLSEGFIEHVLRRHTLESTR